MSISVFIADDHTLMRDGLKALLDKADDITFVGEAADGKEAVQKVDELHPDVVIMDLTMPVFSGLEATREIVKTHPAIKVIVLSMIQDKECILECLKVGAKGYLIKNCAAEELLIAIRTVAGGESYLSRKVIDYFIQGVIQTNTLESKPSVPHEKLSPRELQVLKFIADGLSTKEIAFKLKLSVKTVDVQRHNVMNKLGIHSIAGLVKYAIREGLTSCD